MIRIAKGWLRETSLNFNPEMLSFLAHRITGLGVVLFLFGHMFSLGTRMLGPDAFNKTMRAYDSPLFHFFEWILFLACVFHGLNGLRIIAVDMLSLTRKQRELTFWVVAVTAVLAAGAMLFFFPTVRDAVTF